MTAPFFHTNGREFVEALQQMRQLDDQTQLQCIEGRPSSVKSSLPMILAASLAVAVGSRRAPD